MNSLVTKKNGTHSRRAVLDLKLGRKMDFLFPARGMDINVDLPESTNEDPFFISAALPTILPMTFYDNSTQVRDN